MAQLNEEHLSDIQIELKSAATEKSLATLLQKFAFDEFGLLDTAAILEDECVCESCTESRSFTPESIEEMEMIQYCWLELRQYIRLTYRLTMKGSLKSIDNYYQDYMKDVVSRLVEVCDAHQIFLRLEGQVKEFIIEIKVLLLQILDRMAEKPKLPHIFLTGLLDRYSKVMNAANVIAPVLTQLEEEHFQKFSLTWKILNQRLFQSIIYSDVFFQNSVPLFLSQVGKMNGAEENKKLINEFLKFDNELGIVEGLWIDIESNITHYLQQRPSLNEKKKILIHDCEEYNKASKHKPENIAILDNCVSSGFSPANGLNMEDLQAINIEGAEAEVLTGTCECHVCLDPPLHSPVELIEQVIPLNSHRSGFHLYPHIHGTHGEFGPFLPECELPDLCGKIVEQQHWQGTFSKGMNKINKMDHPFHHHHHHHHHHHPIPKHHPSHPMKKRVDKATQKDQEVVQRNDGKVKIENRKATTGVVHNMKECATDASAHHIHCSKHSDIKRIPFSEQEEEAHAVDDSHSENSQSDPRHCDCCYCEVFGHGLPSTAPMSRNYQEMRERLRLLLNKKKSKCKSNSVSPQVTLRKQQTPGGTPARNTRSKAGHQIQESPHELTIGDESTIIGIREGLESTRVGSEDTIISTSEEETSPSPSHVVKTLSNQVSDMYNDLNESRTHSCIPRFNLRTGQPLTPTPAGAKDYIKNIKNGTPARNTRSKAGHQIQESPHELTIGDESTIIGIREGLESTRVGSEDTIISTSEEETSPSPSHVVKTLSNQVSDMYNDLNESRTHSCIPRFNLRTGQPLTPTPAGAKDYIKNIKNGTPARNTRSKAGHQIQESPHELTIGDESTIIGIREGLESTRVGSEDTIISTSEEETSPSPSHVVKTLSNQVSDMYNDLNESRTHSCIPRFNLRTGQPLTPTPAGAKDYIKNIKNGTPARNTRSKAGHQIQESPHELTIGDESTIIGIREGLESTRVGSEDTIISTSEEETSPSPSHVVKTLSNQVSDMYNDLNESRTHSCIPRFNLRTGQPLTPTPAGAKDYIKNIKNASHPTNSEQDTRALEDLLDFIEGNEVKCRNEKKAAKKARQKEKKRILLNRKKREEEERARLLEQAIQQKKREEALAAKEAEERARANNKIKKRNAKSTNNNNNQTNSGNAEKSNSQKKPGPQMVTIKRVMEPHNSEPTVTITLRGATPNQDRVLYTLLNGQVCKVKDVPAEKKLTNTTKANPSGKVNSSNPSVIYKVRDTPNNDKLKLKKEKLINENCSPKIPNLKPAKELTNPTSIQINNAINSMSKKPSQTFNIADIKLPPGITITKVDPSTVQSRSPKIQETNTRKNTASQIRPSSEVIVVSTGKRKEQPVINKDAVPDNQNGKKKKSKKKNASSSVMPPNGKGSSYPGLEIQPIKIIDSEKDKELVSRMSVLTISPYADNKIDKNDTSKKKKKKTKKSSSNNINHEEWKLLDSVFAPKDIDLDDGEMDDAERELEAFKRFCLQSIPPERKEKVHLNIKDIVLKKKSASYNY